MSIDEPANWKHAAMVQDDDHPEWLRLARLTDADRRAEAKQARDEIDACESLEAEQLRWDRIFAADPAPVVHYSAMVPGRAANASGLNHAGGGS